LINQNEIFKKELLVKDKKISELDIELSAIKKQCDSMIKFKNSNIAWETMYMNAYKKMINNNVRWFKLKSNGFKINGRECNSGYRWVKGVRYCKSAFLPNDKFYN
jgi:hypothetical protein